MKKHILIQINTFLRWLLRHLRNRKYIGIHRKPKKNTPHYYLPVAREIEQNHKEIWSQIKKPVNLLSLRVYCNYSGIIDPYYIPRDIFTPYVEKILNDPNKGNFDMDKNRLDLIIGQNNCPVYYLKNVNGHFLNGNSENITHKKAFQIFNSLKCDFIIKPSINSRQGEGVALYTFSNGAYYNDKNQHISIQDLQNKYLKNYLIQEYVVQHSSTKRFNPDSLNSIRVNTYRSVKTEKIHVLKTFFKMGRKNVIVDNTAPGGLWVNMKENGQLDDFAYTKALNKFFVHPDSGIILKNQKLPFLEKIRNLAKLTAEKFYNHRLLGIDIALRANGEPVVLEANILGIGASQHVGGPYFGKFTEEVIEYCVANRDNDDFRVLQL